MTSAPTLLITTTATRAEADSIARALVEARLAACAQIMPIHSVYRWQGAVEAADEAMVMAKTSAACAEAAIALIRSLHSYAVPEIITLPITGGLPAYLAWIGENTGAETGPDGQ